MKVNRRETCADAVREVVGKAGRAIRYSEIVKLVKVRGTWTDDTIAQDLMSHTVNLPPARFHWKNIQPFLFLNGDGTFEFYRTGQHPIIKD